MTGVLSIANWNFPQMPELLAPWPVRALTSYPQILASAQAAGLVGAADVVEQRRLLRRPAAPLLAPGHRGLRWRLIRWPPAGS